MTAKETATRDSIADVWGPRTPHRGDWPVRIDERTISEPERWVSSVCVLCSTGCGMDIGVADGRIVGRAEHVWVAVDPATFNG